MHPIPQPETVDPEATLREHHQAAIDHLADRRAERERLNETIADLVDDVTVLGRAVAVFDRWHERSHADEPGDAHDDAHDGYVDMTVLNGNDSDNDVPRVDAEA